MVIDVNTKLCVLRHSQHLTDCGFQDSLEGLLGSFQCYFQWCEHTVIIKDLIDEGSIKLSDSKIVQVALDGLDIENILKPARQAGAANVIIMLCSVKKLAAWKDYNLQIYENADNLC